MLRVFGFSNKEVGLFEGYDALLNFITAEENKKLLAQRKLINQGYWGFAEYSSEQLKNACAWFNPGSLTTAQLKALEQGSGLLEICRGDFFSLQEVLVTSEVDVEEFKRKFCLDYCISLGWRLIETQEHKHHVNVLDRERPCVVQPYSRNMRHFKKIQNNKREHRLKAELDCRITRLRQNLAKEKTIVNPQREF